MLFNILQYATPAYAARAQTFFEKALEQPLQQSDLIFANAFSLGGNSDTDTVLKPSDGVLPWETETFLRLRDSTESYGDGGVEFVGNSEPVLALLKKVEALALRDFKRPILIDGPSGSGKELVWKLLHGLNPNRRDKQVTVINVNRFNAMSGDKREETLFGTSGYPGLLLEHNRKRGIFVFDGIEDANAEMQGILLELFDSKPIDLPGGGIINTKDLRIIATKNKEFPDGYRSDLIARLKTKLTLPGLDQRGLDALLVYEHYNHKLSQEMDLEWKPLSLKAGYYLDLFHPNYVSQVRGIQALVESVLEERLIEESSGKFTTSREIFEASKRLEIPREPERPGGNLQFSVTPDENKAILVEDVFEKDTRERFESHSYLEKVHGERPFFWHSLPSDLPLMKELYEGRVPEKDASELIAAFNEWFTLKKLKPLGIKKVSIKLNKKIQPIKSFQFELGEALPNGEYEVFVKFLVRKTVKKRVRIVTSLEKQGEGLWMALGVLLFHQFKHWPHKDTYGDENREPLENFMESSEEGSIVIDPEEEMDVFVHAGPTLFGHWWDSWGFLWKSSQLPINKFLEAWDTEVKEAITGLISKGDDSEAAAQSLGGIKKPEARAVGKMIPINLTPKEIKIIKSANVGALGKLKRADGGDVLLQPFSSELDLYARLQARHPDFVNDKKIKEKLDLEIKDKNVLVIPGYSINGFILAEEGAKSVTVYDADPNTIAWLKAIKKFWHHRELKSGHVMLSVGEAFMANADLNTTSKLSATGRLPKALTTTGYMVKLIKQAIDIYYSDPQKRSEKGILSTELNRNITFRKGKVEKISRDLALREPYDFVFIPWLLGEEQELRKEKSRVLRVLRQIRQVSSPDVRIMITPSDSDLVEMLRQDGYNVEEQVLGLEQNYLIATPIGEAKGEVGAKSLGSKEEVQAGLLGDVKAQMRVFMDEFLEALRENSNFSKDHLGGMINGRRVVDAILGNRFTETSWIQGTTGCFVCAPIIAQVKRPEGVENHLIHFATHGEDSEEQVKSFRSQIEKIGIERGGDITFIIAYDQKYSALYQSIKKYIEEEISQAKALFILVPKQPERWLKTALVMEEGLVISAGYPTLDNRRVPTKETTKTLALTWEEIQLLLSERRTETFVMDDLLLLPEMPLTGDGVDANSLGEMTPSEREDAVLRSFKSYISLFTFEERKIYERALNIKGLGIGFDLDNTVTSHSGDVLVYGEDIYSRKGIEQSLLRENPGIDLSSTVIDIDALQRRLVAAGMLPLIIGLLMNNDIKVITAGSRDSVLDWSRFVPFLEDLLNSGSVPLVTGEEIINVGAAFREEHKISISDYNGISPVAFKIPKAHGVDVLIEDNEITAEAIISLNSRLDAGEVILVPRYRAGTVPELQMGEAFLPTSFKYPYPDKRDSIRIVSHEDYDQNVSIVLPILEKLEVLAQEKKSKGASLGDKEGEVDAESLGRFSDMEIRGLEREARRMKKENVSYFSTEWANHYERLGTAYSKIGEIEYSWMAYHQAEEILLYIADKKHKLGLEADNEQEESLRLFNIMQSLEDMDDFHLLDAFNDIRRYGPLKGRFVRENKVFYVFSRVILRLHVGDGSFKELYPISRFSYDRVSLSKNGENLFLKFRVEELQHRIIKLNLKTELISVPSEEEMGQEKVMFGLFGSSLGDPALIYTLDHLEQPVNVFIDGREINALSLGQKEEMFKLAGMNPKKLTIVVANALGYEKPPELDLPNIIFTPQSEMEAAGSVRRAEHNLHMSIGVDPAKEFTLIGENKFRYPDDESGFLAVALLYTQSKNQMAFSMKYGLKRINGFFSAVGQALLGLVREHEVGLVIGRAA